MNEASATAGSRQRQEEVLVSYPSVNGGAHVVKAIVKDRREKIQAKWMRGDFYEAQRHGMLNYVYRKFRGGTFVDIGAAIGNHSLFFAKCCDAKSVIAFEPVRPLYEHLLQNLKANGVDATNVHNVALGERKATVGMAFRDLPVEQGGMLIGCVDENGAGTRLERLDDMLSDDLDEIRCIKIDVEGYNLPVLQGARSTLEKFHPAVFCECESEEAFNDVDQFLAERGYRVWRINGSPFAMNHTATYLWEHLDSAELTIVITTHNRPAQLKQLIRALQQDAGDFRVKCLVYDDASNPPYKELPAGNDGFQIRYHRMRSRRGKTRYWQLIQRIFDDLRDISSDFYLQLPDDVVPKAGFLKNAIHTFDAIDDPNKICLNLYLDKSRIGRPNWTKRLPTIHRFGDTSVFRTGWVDMIFVTDLRLFTALAFQLRAIPKDRWRRNPRLSSGVGLQITRRLREYSLYQVRHCMLESVETESRMHPNRPAHIDLSVTELDRIVCGVASIPERVAQLEQAVNSILPFVDECNVYLNNYANVPRFLSHPKISAHRSQDHGDLGDAGKFFKVGDVRGFYLAIDDDIVFPEDFVWRMVNTIRTNREKGHRLALGLHGRLMHGRVESFYGGHTKLFHCGRTVREQRSVHVLGTGAVAFHTDDLNISIHEFRGPRNMADIHFSIACQKQDVGCVVLPHDTGYLTLQHVPLSKTIWGQSRREDRAQTELFNSWKDWRLRA